MSKSMILTHKGKLTMAISVGSKYNPALIPSINSHTRISVPIVECHTTN